MQITFIGFIIIFLGILFLFTSIKNLYYLTIFFIPFTATSVLNTASSNSLSASYFLIFLLILYELRNIFLKMTIRIPKNHFKKKSIYSVFLFFLVVLFSLFMPLIIDGDLRVFTGETDNYLYGYDYPLYFSKSLIFKIYPVVFGVLFIYLFVINSNKLFSFKTSLNYFVHSIVFVTLWGFFQLISSSIGIEFPDFIFNTMNENYMMKSNTTFGDYYSSFTRINSVTQEPSHLSLILLCSIPFIFVKSYVTNNYHIKLFFKIILFLVILILLLSTSTTALIGLFSLYFISSYYLSIVNIINFKNFFFRGILLFSMTLLLYFNIESVQSFLNQVLLTKGESSSALVRTFSILSSFNYFLQYPVLGIGWGIATSDDLIINLLANSGLLGLISFFYMIFYIISRSVVQIKKYDLNISSLKQRILYHVSFVISLSTFITISIFLGFLWYQPLFYFLIAVLVAYFYDENKSITINYDI